MFLLQQPEQHLDSCKLATAHFPETMIEQESNDVSSNTLQPEQSNDDGTPTFPDQPDMCETPATLSSNSRLTVMSADTENIEQSQPRQVKIIINFVGV